MTFWETAEQERAGRAHIPALVHGMAHVLVNQDVQQRIYDCVHDQHPVGSAADSGTGVAAPGDGR